MSRSKVKVTGDKKTKPCGILFGSRPLGRGPRVASFSGAVVAGATTPVGKSAHTVYFQVGNSILSADNNAMDDC